MSHGPATSSDLQTSSKAIAAVAAVPATLMGAMLVSDGTNAATLTVYDNASAASGLVLAYLTVPASPTETVVQLNLPKEIAAKNGIYASVSGTGAKYVIYYSLG